MRLRERVLVVGTDLSVIGDDAILEGLAQLVSGAAGVMHVVNVLDPSSFIDDPEKRALTQKEEALANGPLELQRRVREVAAVNGLDYYPARVKAHVRLGRPVETLLQVCVDYGADLLVLGTHQRRGLERLVIGSVAEELVRKARCPVLVARTTNYEGLTKTALPDAPYAPGTEPPPAPSSSPPEHLSSTTLESWEPSGSAPTGFRIV